MNFPDPEDNFLKEFNDLLYGFVWGGNNDNINRAGVCQAHEAGCLRMVDVNSFLSALQISWLKRILCDNGKITNILLKMCPLIQNGKQTGGEFANIIVMQRVKNTFWRDVFKHYKKLHGKRTLVTFDDFASECLHYNVNVCRGKGVFVSRIGWIVALFRLDSFLVQMEF